MQDLAMMARFQPTDGEREPSRNTNVLELFAYFSAKIGKKKFVALVSREKSLSARRRRRLERKRETERTAHTGREGRSIGVRDE